MTDNDPARTLDIGSRLLVLGLGVGFVAVWWWALLGLSRDAGVACAVTSGGLVVLSLVFASVAASDRDRLERERRAAAPDEPPPL